MSFLTLLDGKTFTAMHNADKKYNYTKLMLAMLACTKNAIRIALYES